MINIIKFYEVYCDVEPKRRALAQANAELAAAQEKLSIIKRKVQSLEEQLSKLTADFEQAVSNSAWFFMHNKYEIDHKIEMIQKP